MGFPGETDEDFQQPRSSSCERVRFKNNFIFKYSPRPGTTAWDRIPDDVPDAVKRQRNNDLLALQATISAEVHAEREGRVEAVFVEQVSEKSPKRTGNVELGWERPTIQMSGRTEGDLITVFDLPAEEDPAALIGTIVPIRIVGSGPLLLRGQLVQNPPE